MRIILDWLKETIEFDQSPAALAEMLTLAGLEAEPVADAPGIPDSVRVGKVLSVEKHPDADRLSVCSVDVGGAEPLQIVCGAPNVAAGQRVPVATVGTVLGEEFTIRKSKIRGVASEGMICAEDELGLSGDHSGIMVLGEDSVIGSAFNEKYRTPDVLEVELTPNRPDCFSHWGVIREIAALTGNSYAFQDVKVNETGPDIATLTSVEIRDAQACPRYTARVIRNVKVGPSPEWLRQRIEALGLRSVNNVVDASNYVLMETGHPLHTFDFDKLAGHRIVVRKAERGEKFMTLDHRERELSDDVLLICDAEKPVALAGIMGGFHSEVDDNTVNLLIESAYFDPGTVRKGSKQQQLSTDASKRFERGTDPNHTLLYSQNRLAALIMELAGGEAASGIIDIYPDVIEAKTVSLRYSYLKKIAGMDIAPSVCLNIFKALEFQVLSSDADGLTVKVPTFRPDIEREIDLVEEVLRLYGYDKLPQLSHINMSVSEVWNPLYEFMDDLRNYFCGLGFNETFSNSLISLDQAKKGIWGHEPVEISNPLSQEMSCLRSDLLQNLLTNFRYNATRKRQQLRFFEIGTVFAKNSHRDTGAAERLNLAALVSASVWDLNWNEKPRDAGIYYLKGIVDTLLRKYGLAAVSYTQTPHDDFAYLYTLTVGKRKLGYMGQYKASLQEKFQMKTPVVAFELETEALQEHFRAAHTLQPISLYPAIYRDISLVVRKNIPAELLKKDIVRSGGKNLIDIVIYDEYINSDRLGEDKHALSFRLKFQSQEGTLVDEDIDPVMEKLFGILYDNHGAQLR